MTHSRNYRTLRRLILPTLAGSALAALAFVPTFGAEQVQANVPAQSISAPKVDMPKADVPRPDDVKTGEINEPAPHKEANPSAFTGTAVISESKTFEHQRFDNTISDQNSFIEKNKATITIDSSIFDKTGNTSNDDNSNFRGQNAVVLGIEGSQTSIKNSNITSSSIGSNAVFATEGAHSATLATDRGEGTITAEAAKLITSSEGSPVIYSTGNIMVNNVNGIANNSEIGVVEGKNSITLTNSNVTGYKDNGFMLYQSFSGDSYVKSLTNEDTTGENIHLNGYKLVVADK